jgi:hypothetical protein
MIARAGTEMLEPIGALTESISAMGPNHSTLMDRGTLSIKNNDNNSNDNRQ